MTRNEERVTRSQQEPIVGGLPDVPGILAAIRLTPGLGVHLRGLADELLVNDFPGATLTRARARDARDSGVGRQRLLLLHGLARRVRDGRPRADGDDGPGPAGRQIKSARPTGSTPRCAALLHLARTVQRAPWT